MVRSPLMRFAILVLLAACGSRQPAAPEEQREACLGRCDACAHGSFERCVDSCSKTACADCSASNCDVECRSDSCRQECQGYGWSACENECRCDDESDQCGGSEYDK